MLLFTALFGSLMLLSIESRRRMVAVLLIGCIAILGVSPPPAQAQFCLPCVIQAVLATISQTIGNWLSVINGVVSDIRKLYEQTIWRFPADVTGRFDQFDIGKHDRTPCSKLTDRAENEPGEIDVVTARDRGHSCSIGRVHEIGKVRRDSWAAMGVRHINRRRQWPPNGTCAKHLSRPLSG